MLKVTVGGTTHQIGGDPSHPHKKLPQQAVE